MNVVIDQIAKIAKARREAASSAEKTVRLCVMVAQDCESSMAHAVKDALRPKTQGCKLYVAAYGTRAGMPAVHALGDGAIILVGTDHAAAADLYRAYRTRCVPTLVLVPLETGIDGVQALVNREVASEDIVVCDAQSVAGVLGEWLVESLPYFSEALGAGFECCRNVLLRKIVAEAVRNNAMVGALTFLKSADTPVMMATEMAMVYKLALTNGLSLDEERIPELAGVAVVSFASKALAGFALSRLPLPAPLVKSAVAAAGTLVAGAIVNTRQQTIVSSQYTGEKRA